MSIIGDREPSAAASSGPQGLMLKLRDYFALMKPRVMSLVVFTAFAGMFLAPGGIAPASGFLALVCIAVGAGASGALNMWYDADIDAIMTRTQSRPVPAGRVTAGEALVVGLVLSVASVLALGFGVNWLAGGLLAFTIFFYAVIYTMLLKRRTPQNIVIGGASGAFPPMIGWAAVTGSVSLESILLFLIVFLWTPPHFWSLALFKRDDYEKAGVPMLPVVAGEEATKRQIIIYAVATALIGVAPVLTGMAGLVYGAVAAILGAIFVIYSVGVFRMPAADRTMLAAKKNFAFSIFYLFAIFSALVLEKLVRHPPHLPF